MTPNEEKTILNVIKAVEYEIDKTPSGALRNFLCDLNIILHQKLSETKPNPLISFDDREPEIGRYISLIWENGSDCDCVYNGLDKSITPLPTHWRYINTNDNDNT